MAPRAERRKKLRSDLIEIASRKIEKDGLNSVTARYLAGEAGCAVGAIYNIFEDLNEVFVEVNLRSFGALATRVKADLGGLSEASPHEQLNCLAQSYLDFALERRNHWQALFDINMNADSNVPEIYQSSLSNLLRFIEQPMARVFPDKSQDDISLITQAMFSSIHGIVLLGMQRRLSAVPDQHMRDMIRFIIFQLGDAT